MAPPTLDPAATAAPTFAIYASTGRTGSTFLCDLFRRCADAAVFHYGYALRLDLNTRTRSPVEMLANYVARVTDLAPTRSVYIEGNPRFFEAAALPHAITDPCEVVRLLQAQGVTVRCLFMTRDPRAYAISVKNRWREMGREFRLGPKAPDKETFEQMYGVPPSWLRDQDAFGRICANWLLRNRFLKRLTSLPECLFVRFEDLFDPRVSDDDFVERIQQIHAHFALPAYPRTRRLLVKRGRPRNASKRVEELTDAELEQLRAMCSADAAEWGYSL